MNYVFPWLVSSFIFLHLFVFTQEIKQLNFDTFTDEDLSKPEIQKQIYTYADSLANAFKEKDALVYYNKLLPHIKNDSVRARALINRLTCYYYISEYDSALSNINEPIEYYTGIKDWSILSSLYSIKGLSYLKTGILDSSLVYLFKALDIVETNDLLQDRSDVYHNIVSVFRELKEYDKALSYCLKSSAIDLQLGDSVYYPSGLNGIATMYFLMNNYDSALFYYEKALDWYKISKSRFDIASTYDGLGRTYSNLGNPKKAKFYLTEAYKLNMEKGYKRAAAVNLNNLSTIFRKNKQYDSAMYYVKKSLEMNRRTKNILHVRDNLKTIGVYYFEMKDYKNAFAYNVKYQHLNDSILNQNMSDKIAEFRTRFETEKKEKEIALNNLKLASQKSQLERQKTQQKAMLAAIFVIVMVLALILLYRKRIYRIKLLQLKQTNLINIQQTKLQTQKTERQKVANILHDNLAHLIANSQQSISVLIAKTDDVQPKKILAGIEENLEFAHKIAKVASYELSFSFVLDLNLVDQIEQYIARIKHSHSADISFQCSEKINFESINDETKINLFSAFQELLGNAIKYSKARHINISLFNDGAKTVLQVEDNGIGFDYNQVRHGQGLSSMQERAEKLNGNFTIESESGFGSKMKFVVKTNF
ncbi:MAG: tetratricopeptide repeat protein [Bacteroidales bacterium]|nr:tetratricopeptide repeat protein [Bacteroidales bacterium]